MKNTEDTPAQHKTDSHSSKDIWDMDLAHKTMVLMVYNLCTGGGRLSEVMLENIAHAAPSLTHIGAVVAFVYAQQK